MTNEGWLLAGVGRPSNPMDPIKELGVHQTLEGGMRAESYGGQQANGYWEALADLADDLADRMEQAIKDGEGLEEIELRQFHGLAYPELRTRAKQWRGRIRSSD